MVKLPQRFSLNISQKADAGCDPKLFCLFHQCFLLLPFTYDRNADILPGLCKCRKQQIQSFSLNQTAHIQKFSSTILRFLLQIFLNIHREIGNETFFFICPISNLRLSRCRTARHKRCRTLYNITAGHTLHLSDIFFGI